jgi:transposase
MKRVRPKRTEGRPTRPLGRPKTGKRSNPDYRQHSVWLPGELVADISKALVMADGKRFELSALVESLLRGWLRAGARLPKQ